MNYVRSFVFSILISLFGLYSVCLAQPTLTMVDWVPPQTQTQGPDITLSYQVGGTTNLCEVNFVRDDGFLVSVANVDPTSAQPFEIDLPLPNGLDRVTVTYVGTVRDTVTGEVAAGDRAMSIVVDDIGPDAPNVTSPVLPYTSYSPTFEIYGNCSNNPPAGGQTDTPETGGYVVIYDPATLETIGGGVIRTDSQFTASIDMSTLASGTNYNLNMHAVDQIGNVGTTRTIQLRYEVPPPPSLSDLTMTPPDGTITNDAGVLISGTVDGTIGPFTVNVYVDGFIQSQIAGLAAGESFNHTLTLPGEGPHTISIEAVNSDTPPSGSGTEVLGTVTLDRTPPVAPIILQPDPNVSPYITHEDSFDISGILSETDSDTGDGQEPQVLLAGPPGISFNPASPLSLDASGRFASVADLSNLADGTYTITVSGRDEAGNTGPESSTQIVFVRDTTSPIVEEIRVNGVVAPQTNPEIYVGATGVRLQVRVNEDMPTTPSLGLTQDGYSEQAAGLSSAALRVFEYHYGALSGYDGPVTAHIHDGADRAGNSIDATISRLFIVDTQAPLVVSVDPTDGTSVNTSPSRIRISFEDPPSPAGTASGIDLAACEITVEGPIGNPAAVAGSLVPYDPVTLDFVPSSPLSLDGTYRVNITAVDKVGNRATTVTRTFIFDTTPITPNSSNVRTNPENGAAVNATTIPGTSAAPFVEAFVSDPQFDAAHSIIKVRDYCRVPVDVPGTQTTTGPENLTYTFSDPLPSDGSRDGVYTIELDIRDFAGNLSPTYITTFTYDTLAPSVQRTFPSTYEVVRGPLRIVDATFADPRVDFCRKNSGIDKQTSTLELWLTRPNQYLNTTEAPHQVPGTLRFITVNDIERVLLEIVNNSGYVTGLATDGSDDGEYELRMEAVDRAGNRSGLTTVSFTYDTQTPRLEVDDIKEDCTITVPTLEFGGVTQDNRGGSGINRVEVSLRAVNDNGYPTSDPPIFDKLHATLAPLGLGPFNPSPPERSFTFSADISQVVTDTRALLIVRSYDEGGNFAEIRHIVNVLADTLPPPTLSAPAHESSTSTHLVEFSWSSIAGAEGYRIRIVTPNQNEITREVDQATSVVINLGAYSDGDGRYTWAVAARDCAHRYGDYSRNRVFTIDRGRPTVVAVDIYDPSPEAVGSVNEGEVRFTIHFSEDMDTTRPLTVRIHPEDSRLDPLEVTQMSFSGDTWTGRAFIPDAQLEEPDYNGVAVLHAAGGFDLGGNPMIEPTEAFTIFEIDTGPFFQVALFANPVNVEDIILIVKGTCKRDGAAERLVEPLTVVVSRAGQGDQMPSMYRMTSETFRGSFFLDNNFVTDLDIRITGRDQQGNTATRTIHLDVNRITSGEGGIVINQNRSMILSAGPGAVTRDQNIYLSSACAALADGGSNLDSGELVEVARLGAVAPQGLLLPGGVDLLVDLAKLRGDKDEPPADSSKAGLYRLDGGKWIHLEGWVDGDTLHARLDKTGPLAVMADLVPPKIVSPVDELKLDKPGQEVIISVSDPGSGIDPVGVSADIDGEKVDVKYDSKASSLVIETDAGLASGAHALNVKVRDHAGNEASASTRLVAAPEFGFSEAVVYPNPSRTRARIRYLLNQDAERVSVAVYDAAGERVTVLDGPSGAGRHEVEWNLIDRRGGRVANGVYFIRLTAVGAGVKRREHLRLAVLR